MFGGVGVGGGSILCTYSVELYPWSHELCVGGYGVGQDLGVGEY